MTLPPTAIAARVLRRLAGRRVLRLGLAEVEVYNTNPYLSLHVTMGGAVIMSTCRPPKTCACASVNASDVSREKPAKDLKCPASAPRNHIKTQFFTFSI